MVFINRVKKLKTVSLSKLYDSIGFVESNYNVGDTATVKLYDKFKQN